MKQVCIGCGMVCGEKDPVGDWSYTHKICQSCREKIKKERRELKLRKEKDRWLRN